MEKEEVLKALKKEGRFKEYDELYRDDVSLSDWVARNEDLIRSNRNIAKAVGVDAPHGGVSDSYYEGQEQAKDKYENQEQKLQEAQSEKQKLADEYFRAKELDDASKFRWERSTDDMNFEDRAKLVGRNLYNNLIALGMKLTPQAAKNVYIKEGYNPDKIGLQAGLGTMANVSELLPGTGPWARAATTFVGPAIRAGQGIYEGQEAGEVARNFAHDAGLNTLFEYMPSKEAYGYIKRILGDKGGAGEKAVKNTAEKFFDNVDALDNAKEAHQARMRLASRIEDFKRQYDKGLLNDTEIMNFADMVESEYPELAKQLRTEVNMLAENRNAARNLMVATEIGNKGNMARHGADEIVTSRKLGPQREKVSAELMESAGDARRKATYDKPMLDEEGNLIEPIMPYDSGEIWKLGNASKAAKVTAKALPAGRAIAKGYTGPDIESSAPKARDYEAALDYIINNYARQWDAGFKPRDGIELEAWKKYKGIK